MMRWSKIEKGEQTTYIYIYAVKLLSGPSLGFSKVIIWAKFVFLKTLFVPKFPF